MELPPLPRILKKREADVTPLVLAWFKENYPKSVALEVKVGKNKLLPHQEAALREVSRGSFSYKLLDSGARMPFDAFVLIDADAFLVICNKKTCQAFKPDKSFCFEFKV